MFPASLRPGTRQGGDAWAPIPQPSGFQHGSVWEETVHKMGCGSCNTHCSDGHGLLHHPPRGSWASPHGSHAWDRSLEDIKQAKSIKTTSLKPLLQVGRPPVTAAANNASPFPAAGLVSYLLGRTLLLQSWWSHSSSSTRWQRSNPRLYHIQPPVTPVLSQRRDSHLQQCQQRLVNTLHWDSHHVQPPKLTPTWLLSLQTQHKLQHIQFCFFSQFTLSAI